MHVNYVRVEFDPTKDVSNRGKHGISLARAVDFDWNTAIEREDTRFDYGEIRFVAVGRIDARLYVMIFTDGSDDDTVRVVSLRPAEKHETRSYHDQIRSDDPRR